MDWKNRELPSLPISPEHAYDLSAQFYDEWSWQSFWRSYEFPPIREAMARYRRGRGRTLSLIDVGCGTGWYLENLHYLCRERVGIDLSNGMLAVARYRLQNAMLMRSDANTIPFRRVRFDAVLCTRVFSHIRQIAPTLREMHRVLVDGGLLIISDVDADHEYMHTKLPTAAGSIFAKTYKHDRRKVFQEVEHAGFVSDSGFLIYRDGETREVKPRRSAQAKSSIAGWIGIWRKTSHGHSLA